MILEIDIHGETELDALKKLEKFIAAAPKTCKEIVVIHGYHSGVKLQNMVRDPNKLRSRRIVRRRVTLNRGETILELQ